MIEIKDSVRQLSESQRPYARSSGNLSGKVHNMIQAIDHISVAGQHYSPGCLKKAIDISGGSGCAAEVPICHHPFYQLCHLSAAAHLLVQQHLCSGGTGLGQEIKDLVEGKSGERGDFVAPEDPSAISQEAVIA